MLIPSKRIAKLYKQARRPRERVDVVPNFVCFGMIFDGETFFAGLNVLGQSAVCKAGPVWFIDHVNDAARVERVKAEVMSKKNDVPIRLDRRVRV